MSRPGATPAPVAREPYDAGRLRGEALFYERVGSTNELLRELAAEGAPEGLAVVAREQTAGRGRHGRSWHSPPGVGFYGSVLLRPACPLERVALLTLAAAVAVAEALGACGAEGVEIKWPNDVQISGRKVCGILTETGLVADRVAWAVVGVGVNLGRGAVPAEGLSGRATSLEEAGVRLSAEELLRPLMAALGRWYAALLEADSSPVVERWEALSPMARGCRVAVDAGAERYEATTRGLTPVGLLRVERDDGRLEELAAAEVSVVRCPLSVAPLRR